MAGEPFKFDSVTAEAGKLPTLKVRPFWPFQVVELGLWEEALVKEMRAGGEWGLGSYRILLRLCAVELHLPEARKAFFSATRRALWACSGSSRRPGLRWISQDPVGKGGNEVKDQGSRNWGQQKRNQYQEGGREFYWGWTEDMRLSPALNDSDGITMLHPEGAWLCDIPYTMPFRRPGL